MKQAQIQETKRAQRRVAKQLNQTYRRLKVVSTEAKTSQKRLKKADRAVRTATTRLLTAEERLALQRRRFARRIAASYRGGSVTYAHVLLASRNLSDFLDRQYYVNRVITRDAALVGDLRKAQSAVQRERERLLDRKAVLRTAHEENARRVARVASQAETRARLLEAIRRERALQERRLAQLEADSNEIQGTLEREMRRRLANPRAYRTLPRWSGRLSRPAGGRVTSGFGYRYHPVLRYRRLHTGVDFAAGYGAGVYAAAPGEVFFASWRGGYGQCIIVLHGGGVSTLYAHLSAIRVRPGQRVRAGQNIGAVGSTGLSTGPHLHFEVRRNGVPVNPM